MGAIAGATVDTASDEEVGAQFPGQAEQLPDVALAVGDMNAECRLAEEFGGLAQVAVEQWSLTSLREKLIKIGAKIVRHGRYFTFQMAEVVIPRDLFADILRRIDRLRPPPAPA